MERTVAPRRGNLRYEMRPRTRLYDERIFRSDVSSPLCFALKSAAAIRVAAKG